MDKSHVIAEIKRLASMSGGRPPGRERFEKEAGISQGEWYPHLWLRWGDALLEAGFAPNEFARKLDRSVVLQKYVSLIRELGHVPLHAELRVKARSDPSFPSHSVFSGIGSKTALLTAVREYCQENQFADVLSLLPAEQEAGPQSYIKEKEKKALTGYVYLMKSGRHFKIGRTNSVGRREWELGIKIPIPPSTLHAIETDDPIGVEAYWHRRFADKRGEGEWFNLLPVDIAAFKKWRKIA